MERLKLNFDINIDGSPNSFTVELPYQEGMVATSEFCPPELLVGSIDLLAALRGETLDKFIADSRLLLSAISRISDVENLLDRFIGGLMVMVMNHLSNNENLSLGDLLLYVDCFSLLLKAAGFTHSEIREMYPEIVKAIITLYPDSIIS
ncbi:MAG: hypothetical protein K2J82_11985 [Muribaculaceae bacterium]|nr:hypothetical protein [Muribaculaceae bacterium]MDE6755313.1 hypothetical protein [Muribaculaceae bacterium]